MTAVPSTPAGARRSERETDAARVGTLGHYACGALGAALTLLALSLVYSTAVALVGIVPLLSTTFLVVGTVVAWVCVWLVLEAVLGYARRPASDRQSG